MKSFKTFTILLTLTLMLILAACGGQEPAENETVNDSTNTANNDIQNQTNDTNAQNHTDDNADEQDQDQPVFEPLPAEPQTVQIPTEDGRTLEGLYYPARVPDAPVVVLMHWAPGSQDDWVLIAPWLQNRWDELSGSHQVLELAGLFMPQISGWTDDSWFPPLPAEISFAVLTFNFGGYGSSLGGRSSWLQDAQAAVDYAASLEGVNSHKIATLGASIGADGAVDGCYLFNDRGEMGTCIGALSLSPGNYITDQFTYTEAVTMLDLEGHLVWCLAAENDGESPTICRETGGEHYRSFIFAGDAHGMLLIEDGFFPQEPAVDLDTMQLIQEWLEEVFGLTLNDFNLN